MQGGRLSMGAPDDEEDEDDEDDELDFPHQSTSAGGHMYNYGPVGPGGRY